MHVLGRVIAFLLVGGLLAGCASELVAGTPGIGTGAPGTTVIDPPSCDSATAVPAGDMASPTAVPLITLTQGTNAWIASELTQPLAVAVYPDGSAIRIEELGTSTEPLPRLTIGRLSACRLAAAVAEIEELAITDLGEAQVTDQGTTTVTLRGDSGEVVVEVYALGIGDDTLPGAQRAARERLSTLIDDLTEGMTQTSSWIPDRVRVSLVGKPRDLTSILAWPLVGTIAQTLEPQGRRVPCSVFAGDDAAAIRSALGAESASSSWTDGTTTAVLAVGVLMPGQVGCSAG